MKPPDQAPVAEGLAEYERLYSFLALNTPRPPESLDVALGFGHFDLRIVDVCARAFLRGEVSWLLFTGGLGAGTADLGKPEALAFLDYLRAQYPEIPEKRIILETQSTNTGENIRFSIELLARTRPLLAFGQGLRSALLVATPYRMRRVLYTFRLFLPGVNAWCQTPEVGFSRDKQLFASKGQDFEALLLGELDRLVTYPQRGWMLPAELPAPLLALREALARRVPGRVD